MEGSWWRQRNELDQEQEAIIGLPFDGRYLIQGPPGSGKTNLLLLRAAFMAKSGLRNQMVLTFGTVLSAFIDTGKKEIDSHQISTMVKWFRKQCHEQVSEFTKQESEKLSALQERERFKAGRRFAAQELHNVYAAKPHGSQLYDAMFVDEVQDLLKEELGTICEASSRVTIAGDSRQSIYHGDAMQVAGGLGFQVKPLSAHYRIGKAIARVADKLSPPAKPEEALEATTNYDETRLKSRAEHKPLPNRKAQFDAMQVELRGQRRAYPGEALAVLIPRTAAFDELRGYFQGTGLEAEVAYHEGDSGPAQFSSGAMIHVMTVSGSQGTEFRAVHLFACEDAQGPQDTAEFWYTAVTRAKTTLVAYSSSTGQRPVSARLLSAFAVNENPTIDDLF
jgi:superfamily I DNA/RNA helicase